MWFQPYVTMVLFCLLSDIANSRIRAIWREAFEASGGSFFCALTHESD